MCALYFFACTASALMAHRWTVSSVYCPYRRLLQFPGHGGNEDIDELNNPADPAGTPLTNPMFQSIDLPTQHAQMLNLLHEERLALLDGEVSHARALLEQLRELQEMHIEDEESGLIPYLPESARWHARVYLAEHRKLSAMLDELRLALKPLPARVPDGTTRLALLDIHAPFRHVLEHHFEREEKGLFLEVQR